MKSDRPKLDAIDRKLLQLLQVDATLQTAELAARVELSPTPCWRRVQRLKEAGVIRGNVALVDAQKINLGVTAYVSIRMANHSIDWLERFKATVQAIPEVVEFHRMAGEVDYLLKVMVPDIAGYDAIYKRLITGAPLMDVSAAFAMESIKSSTALPVDYAC